jgi:hypothetical protein
VAPGLDCGPSVSGPFGAWALVVDRATTGWNLGKPDGNWVDGIVAPASGWTPLDENNHLAKVRVAGSNPVVRSRGKIRSTAVYAAAIVVTAAVSVR